MDPQCELIHLRVFLKGEVGDVRRKLAKSLFYEDGSFVEGSNLALTESLECIYFWSENLKLLPS